MTDNEQTPHDEQLSRLYRQLPDHEPSPLMDQRIRKMARRAARKRYWPSLSAAAIVILGIGIGLHVIRQQAALTPVDAVSSDEAVSLGRERVFGESRHEQSTSNSLPTSPAAPKRLPAAPASMAPQAERAVEAAAGVRPRQSMPEIDCAAVLLPQQAPASDWRARIDQLRLAGRDREAACLQQAFEQQFAE